MESRFTSTDDSLACTGLEAVPTFDGRRRDGHRAEARLHKPVDVVVLLGKHRPVSGEHASRQQARIARTCHRVSPLTKNVGRALLNVARWQGTSPAIITATASYSYHWLKTAAMGVRNELLFRRSFGRGDRVILLAENSPEYVAAFYGTLLAGGVAVPLPPDVEDDRLNGIVDICDSRIVLTTPQVRSRRAILADSPVRNLRLGSAACATAADFDDRHSADDLAAILFTAGSTGQPKGVMLSHNNLLSNAWTIGEYLNITQDERSLVVLPFCHAFGNSILQTHILAGAALILDGSLTFPNSIPNAIQTHQATSFSGVPEVYQILLSRSSFRRRGKSLRYMTVAGGALEPGQALEVARQIAPASFYVMYGQSEATARLSYLRPDLLSKRAGSIGKGLDGVSLQVVDAEDRLVAPGQMGEIRARGPNVMLGYWKDAEATSQVLRNGWLYTGDLAVTDEEGFIYPRGRLSALVKVSGHRVHPAELEEFITRRIPGVRAAATAYTVAGGGMRLALFVQAHEHDKPISIEAIHRICRDGLPRHKVPAYMELLDTFPLNGALKVDRPRLARRAASRSWL